MTDLEFAQRRDHVLRWVQSEGAIFCYDEHKSQRLKKYIAPVIAVFPEIAEGVSAIYVYKMSDQPGPLSTPDAINWIDVTADAGALYAIGISVEALDRDEAYTQLCFLHEYTHVLVGGKHSKEFHDCLDDLIERFNNCTGRHVANDYYGLTD